MNSAPREPQASPFFRIQKTSPTLAHFRVACGLGGALLTLLSCTTAPAGPSPVAVSVTPAPVSDRPLPAAPDTLQPAVAATPAPRITRVRLQGRALVGDTPWALASLMAFDLATQKPISLQPWREQPGSEATPAPPTTRRDGTFDVEMPVLPPGTLVKLVVTQGRHSMVRVVETWRFIPATAPASPESSLRTLRQVDIAPIQPASDTCHDSGPTHHNPSRDTTGIPSSLQPTVGAIRPSVPSAACENLIVKRPPLGSQPIRTEVDERYSMGQSSLQIIPGQQDVDLTPATTAVSTAFEGALRLTFMLSLESGVETRGAILQAINQNIERVRAVLAREPNTILRLLESTDAQGRIANTDLFRQVLSQAGVLNPIQSALQETLRQASLLDFDAPSSDAAPITSADFPTMDVVISQGGWLGFPGQEQPIQLPGVGGSHFVSTPSRGGGGAPPAPIPGPDRIFNLTHLPSDAQVRGMTLLRGLAAPTLGLARGNGGITLFQLPEGPDGAAPWGVIDGIRGITQTQNPASTTIYVSSTAVLNSTELVAIEPLAGPPVNTVISLVPSASQIRAMVAGTQKVFWALNEASASISWFSQSDPTGINGVVVHGGSELKLNHPQAFALYEEVGIVEPTLFVGTTDGNLYQVQDQGASATLATGLGDIYGLAFATPHLYISDASNSLVLEMNLAESPPTSRRLVSQVGAGGVFQSNALVEPRGLVVDGAFLYIQCNDGLTAASGTAKIIRVKR